MKETGSKIPIFVNEEEEAEWWASAKGRAFIKRHSTAGMPEKQRDPRWWPNLTGQAASRSRCACPLLMSPRLV